MTIYHWVLLLAFGACFVSCLFFLLQVLASGGMRDPAKPRGKTLVGIAYSFTGGMSPLKKETAFRHLPTYTAGIIFHLGTFLSFFWLALHFLAVRTPHPFVYASILFLLFSTACGVSILIKRILNPVLRSLSNPDDYASNLLVTGLHALSVTALLATEAMPVLFVYGAVLFVYLPLGKLRHTVYFFAARIHLGVFHGKRGVWALRRQKT